MHRTRQGIGPLLFAAAVLCMVSALFLTSGASDAVADDQDRSGPYVTVTYHILGDTDAVSICKGDPMPEHAADDTENGRFLGWSLKDGLVSELIEPGLPVYTDTDVWAVFADIAEDLEYDSRMHTVELVDRDDRDIIVVNFGDSVPLPRGAHAADGEVFTGWFTEQYGGDDMGTMPVITEDTVLYARYMTPDPENGSNMIIGEYRGMYYIGGRYYIDLGTIYDFRLAKVSDTVQMNGTWKTVRSEWTDETEDQCGTSVQNLREYFGEGADVEFIKSFLNGDAVLPSDSGMVQHMKTCSLAEYVSFIRGYSGFTQNSREHNGCLGAYAEYLVSDVHVIMEVSLAGSTSKLIVYLTEPELEFIPAFADGENGLTEGTMPYPDAGGLASLTENMTFVALQSILIRNGDRIVMDVFGEKGYTVDSSDFDHLEEGMIQKGFNHNPISADAFDRDAMYSSTSVGNGGVEAHVILMPEQYGHCTMITDWEELNDIRDDMDGSYVLVKDIQAGFTRNAMGAYWNRYVPFTGELYGAGHTIEGLEVECNSPTVHRYSMGSSGNNYAFTGLFAEIHDAVVKDITFKDCSVWAYKNKEGEWQAVGVLAGYARNSVIENINMMNISVDTDDTAASNCVMGTLVGLIEHGTIISDCIVDENCKVWADGNSCYGGGIAGSIEHGGAIVDHCINHGFVFSRGYGGWWPWQHTSSVSGGIVAVNKFEGYRSIEYCLASGKVCTQIDHGNCNSGGMIGKSYDGSQNAWLKGCAISTGILFENGGQQGDKFLHGGSYYSSGNICVNRYDIFNIPGWHTYFWDSNIRCNGNSYTIDMDVWFPD